MRVHDRFRFSSILVPATLLLALGCADGLNVIGPENQLEVTNATGQLQFQVSNLVDVTDVRRYDWQNTGTRATIDVSEAVASGTAILTIRDANGVVVYREDIADDSDGTTPEGVPGTWQIEVTLTNVTGTFNFRVQKTT